MTRLGLLRSAGTIVGLILCLSSAWSAGRMGYSRLLSRYGMFSGVLAPVNRSVELSPADPEAHFARAIVFKGAGEFDEAIRELQQAIDLRPGDYFLWLEVGQLRDQVDDEPGALEAFNEAVRLAPFYAQPRWQLGNLLLRMGKFDQAFLELRGAAASDPKLVRPLIDMAWMAYRSDAEAVKSAVQPVTQNDRIALARFFAGHGKANDALKIYRLAKRISPEQRSELLTVLLEANEYEVAYEIWASGQADEQLLRQAGLGIIHDGGFENDIDLSDLGFGWQAGPGNSTVKISPEERVSKAGRRSLRLDWSGDSDPSKPVLTHLVLIEPETQYRLWFSARTEKLVSGSLPLIAIREAGLSGVELSQSPPLARGTSEWREYTVNFVTSRTTQAVLIALRRQDCNGGPCPIFGRAWFDLVRLEKLEGRHQLKSAL